MTQNEKDFLVRLTNDFVMLWQTLSEEDKILLVDIIDTEKLIEIFDFLNTLIAIKTIS